MCELRRDPVVDRWVIISAERASRPVTARAERIVEEDGFCPFCRGAESSTPPEVFALRSDGSPPDSPGWRLRVVPNKFPALGGAGAPQTHREGPYVRMDGIGVHEVIIETPYHDQALADLPVGRVAELFDTVRLRFAELKKDNRLVCIQYFKNHGHSAGASIAHPHSQIIAMPVMARSLKEELDCAERHYVRTGGCIYCQIMRNEISSGRRVVSENGEFLAFTPYASRFPYEIWIIPRTHTHCYEESAGTKSLAEIFVDVSSKMNRALDSPPYNLMLHTAPTDNSGYNYYHWRMELVPVTTRLAGFEWGAGFHINTTPPEEAARRLRTA